MDVICSEDDFSRYKLIVAPMMYLCTEQAGAALEAFVAGGGTLVATYWSGIVNESDLCHLGGFPGPLRQVLGIWSEEMDGLHEGERNEMVCLKDNALGLEGSYGLYDLCDLIPGRRPGACRIRRRFLCRASGADGSCLLGKAKAYYLASRAKEPFYADFYARLIREAGVRQAIDTELPEGVTAQLRSDGGTDYVFVLNFSGRVQQVKLDSRQYTDVLSGETVKGGMELNKHGFRILKRNAMQIIITKAEPAAPASFHRVTYLWAK
ncbi:beta-galactosidase trimerization domain-containing protein [Paenibacillus sp. JTLBN-2024]